MKPFYTEPSGELYNMDCLELMKTMADKSVDLCLTDPPYGIGADKNANKNGIKRKKNGFREYPQSDWDSCPPPQEYFNEIFRISKNQIIWGGNYFQTKINKDSMCWLFWDKGQRNFSFADGELAWTSFNTAVRAFNFSRSANLKENGLHPTQKPLELMRWCLQNYAKQGDTIFDPFAGSGTTGRACKDMGFKWIMCEKEPKYCSIIVKRLAQEVLF